MGCRFAVPCQPLADFAGGGDLMGKSRSYKDPAMGDSKGISIAIVPLIVIAVAIIGYGYLIGGVIKWGDYILVAVIAGAAVLGAGITIFASSKPAVCQIRSKITHARPIVVKDYRLAYATKRSKGKAIEAIGKVSGVIVKVANGDACPHRVAVDVDINDEPVNRVIRCVDIDPGATMYVAVPLPRKFPLEDIDSLSIALNQNGDRAERL